MKYFLHDTNAFQDEKIAELFIAHGYEGLGLFYSILEKLAYQEKPVKTAVLKRQLSVGKKLERCWAFLEEIGLISSNNGETFNVNLLKFSEKYQIAKEKTRERVAAFRENQALTKDVTGYNRDCNAPKVKESKGKESKVKTTQPDVAACAAGASESEKKIVEVSPLQNSPADASHTGGAAAHVGTRKPAARPIAAAAALLTGELADLLSPGGDAARVQTMKQPLTQPEADALVARHGTEAARQILLAMANHARLITGYVSANLTAQNWLDKRTKAALDVPQNQLLTPQRHAVYQRTLSPAARAQFVPDVVSYGSLD